jgi:hypothetical protein
MNPPEEPAPTAAASPGHYYSYGIPYLSIGNYPAS